MATRYTPRVSTSRDDDEGDDVSHFKDDFNKDDFKARGEQHRRREEDE